MKRTLFSFLCVVLPLFAMAQVKDYSHWSVSGGLGINVYDGDASQDLRKALPTGGTGWSAGVEVEYAFTPIWGVSLDYYYLPYKGKFTDSGMIFPGETTHQYAFKTNTNNIDLNVTVNLMKLVFPELKTKWHVNSSVGAGLAMFKLDPANLTTQSGTALLKTTTDIVSVAAYEGNSNYRSMTFPLSLSAEYNINNSLALGLKGQFRSYNKDNLEGFRFIDYNTGKDVVTDYARKPWRGTSNDMAEALTIYARYKINAVNKDHLRNITMKQFNENEDLKKLQAEVKGLKGQVDGIDGKINDLTPRVEKLEKTLSPDGPDDDGDGVPNSRDKEPATPKGNEVDFYGRTVPGLKHIGESDLQNVTPDQLVDGKDSDNDGVPDNRDKEPNTPKGNAVDFWGVSVKGTQALGDGSVYFDFDKVDLDAEALRTIKLVAEKMKANPSAVVEIRGYADFIGGIPYNQKLSQRRADVVKDKLVADYGIDASKLIANGKGKLFEPKKAYRLNRRCNFFFSK